MTGNPMPSQLLRAVHVCASLAQYSPTSQCSPTLGALKNPTLTVVPLGPHRKCDLLKQTVTIGF